MEKAFDLRVLALYRAFKRQLSCKSGFWLSSVGNIEEEFWW